MRTLSIDLETYSSVSLKTCGVYAYAASPDFEILLFGYAWDDEPVIVIDLAQGQSIPEDVQEALSDPEVIKTAYNASFERVCLGAFYGARFDPMQWRCTAVMASELGLPRSLEAVGQAIGLPEDKQKLKTGKALIRYFCMPCKPTKANGQRERNLPAHDAERWKLFVDYNKQDVETERAIRKQLLRFAIDPQEWELYAIDQNINDRGVKADVVLARRAVECDEIAKDKLSEEYRRLTGIDKPKSVLQLKDWIFRETGEVVESLERSLIDDVKAKLSNNRVTAALDMRAGLSKTSTEKYAAILRTAGSDDRIRGLTQFYGANRTGRWAGRFVQMQNLPRNEMNDDDLDCARELVKSGNFSAVEMLFDDIAGTLSQLVRTAFIPREGCQFIVSDFSAIEARVIAWLANESWRKEVFANDGDIYCASASQMFKVPVVKHGINGHLRQKGKIAELALGYGGAVGALVKMGAYKMGLEDKELLPLVKSWRKSNPNICNYWWTVGDAATETILTGKETHLSNGIRFRKVGPLLRLRLPSGRELSYVHPKVRGEDHSIIYEGTIQKTNQWGEIETYGPKLVENIVQATSRDCLAAAIKRLELLGISVVFHVHDEVICEVPVGNCTPEDIRQIMAAPIEWAPGLLLNADAYSCAFYRKD